MVPAGLSPEVLLSRDVLQTRIAELGRQISTDYAGRKPLLIGILKGAAMFMMDLIRAIDLPLSIDFMAVSSYGAATESSGIVRILKDLDSALAGRDVILVEDIIDSGLTIAYVLDMLRRREPASLKVCALLVKEKAAAEGLRSDYVGFTIPNKFVVGYGLDLDEQYRNLPYLGVLSGSEQAAPGG
ncbi:MAG: hypoxanthine phosphoribosyltransferase [Chloroflexi bacterium]|nr:hypoxanthine phosphoribosyltransferase [Chloroflexota bacterium]